MREIEMLRMLGVIGKCAGTMDTGLVGRARPLKPNTDRIKQTTMTIDHFNRIRCEHVALTNSPGPGYRIVRNFTRRLFDVLDNNCTV